MRVPMIAGNWKMNTTVAQAVELVRAMAAGLDKISGIEKIVCPPFVSLVAIKEIIGGTSIKLGAQNLFYEEKGAYTGEISPLMLAGLCDFVIIGHSERRQRGHDTDHSIGERFDVATKAGLKPIFCMGETLDEYEEGITDIVTIRQLNAVIAAIGVKGLASGVLAYEPVWAIGTGKAASPEHAQNILSFLRGHIELLDAELAQNIRILYGGSVKADNATKLFSMPDIDGGLVGGASLNTDEFVAICQAASDV